MTKYEDNVMAVDAYIIARLRPTEHVQLITPAITEEGIRIPAQEIYISIADLRKLTDWAEGYQDD